MKTGDARVNRIVSILPVRYRRFGTYILVGIMNTAVDFIVFTLVISLLTDNKIIAQSAGYAAGLTNSFILNRQFTFGKDATNTLKAQLLRFILVNGVAYAVSLLVIELLAGQLGMNVYLAKVFTSGAVMVVNYLLYKVFVFMVK